MSEYEHYLADDGGIGTLMGALLFFAVSFVSLGSIPLIYWIKDRKRVRWDEQGNCIQCSGTGQLDDSYWGYGDRIVYGTRKCDDCNGLGKRT